MFASLRHGTISRADHQNSAIHLGGTRDHVFDVIGVSRTVNVGIVTTVTLVFNVRNRDGDGLSRVTNGSTLGDIRIGDRRRQTFFGLNFDNRGGQSGLAMVNVADGANVDVGFRSLK